MQATEAGKCYLLGPTFVVHEQLPPQLDAIAILSPGDLNSVSERLFVELWPKDSPEFLGKPSEVEGRAVDVWNFDKVAE